jgi:protein tyrosine phosphatase (PTP) superfamily phosphohydrolase (DUF442 family)
MRKASDWAKVLLVQACVVIALAAVSALIVAACCQSTAPALEQPAPASQPTALASQPTVQATTPRPPNWAEPLQLPGLPNLHKVSDDLYRGAQPTAEGFRELKKLGIKTVVNLCSNHSDLDDMDDLGLGYVSIPMHAWHPEQEDVVQFLKVVADPTKTPVFVHCQHGADRTGGICAAYRVAVQGWKVEDAIKEMIDGGFGFHFLWRGLISNYLRGLDYAAVREQAGIAEEAPRRAAGP